MKTFAFPKGTIVLGGAGMVGSYVDPSIPKFSRSNGYDLTDIKILEKIFNDYKPKRVILLAAMTNVVGAEDDPNGCYAVNSYLPYRTALLCKKYGSWLCFISSVDIFNGEKETPYVVGDEADPIVVYGHSKAMAEAMIQATYKRSLIIRAGWMFGGIREDKKFVSYIMKQIAEGKKLKAVNDRIGSPTYSFDLVEFIHRCSKELFTGLVQFCNSGKATRYLQARIIAEEMGLDPNSVEEASQSDFPNFRSLKNATMVPSVLTRSWEDALHEYVKDWRKHEAI